ncbi:MAG: hypothetical protein AAGA65_21735 [Actinomycetota bacterium]
MLSPMAGRRGLLAAVTTFFAVVVLSLAAAACSSDGDDLDAELEAAPSSTSTSSTTAETTTSTEATTTTLSEQAQAEADVAQLVTDYWLTEIDTSKGEIGLDFLTGAVAARNQEAMDRFNAEGRVLRDQGQKRIEVIEVDVNISDGQGEVTACMGSASEIVDAATQERIGNAADPDLLTTTLFLVEQTPDGWRISELFASVAAESPEFCEIDA